MQNNINVIDDFVPSELYEKLLRAGLHVPYTFGWRTPDNADARYWHFEIAKGAKANTEDVSQNIINHPIKAFGEYVDFVKSHLKEKFNCDLTKVLRCYMNAHTYGTDGWPHTDTDRDGENTIVLYLVPEWELGWGGETVVFDQGGNIDKSVIPRKNRALLFPSERLHAPRPLSRAFKTIRVVLVLKFEGKWEK